MFAFIISLLSKFLHLTLGISNIQGFPPPLDRDEEYKLFGLARSGDESARTKLIEHNLRLVSHIVRKYYSTSKYQDDLISIGSIGLIKAVDTFDQENGTRFATYAAKCIQNEILMYFRSRKKLSAEVSINETIDVDKDGNPLTYIDVISCEDSTPDEIDQKNRIKRVMNLINNLLTEREREIIILRFGLCGNSAQTQKQVADKLGISRSYVSRIEKNALTKLREHMGAG